MLLTSVWAADLAGPVIDAGDQITAAMLDDDRIGLVRRDGTGTLLDHFARDGMEGPPSWSTVLEHDIQNATFAWDGSLAATGWLDHALQRTRASTAGISSRWARWPTSCSIPSAPKAGTR